MPVTPSLPTDGAVELQIPSYLHRALHPPLDKPMGVGNISVIAELLTKRASQTLGTQGLRNGPEVKPYRIQVICKCGHLSIHLSNFMGM